MENDNIFVINLISGDYVIGELREENDYVVIHKPLRLAYAPGNMAIMPFCPFSDDEQVKIPTKFIIHKSSPSDPVLTVYKQKTSQIVVPKSKLLMS